MLCAQRAGSDWIFEVRQAGLEPFKHAAGSVPSMSGCDGDSQELRWADFLRGGLAVGLKT